MKYEVGADTQTVLNLLDWDGVSPLAVSAGWRSGADTVTGNGLTLTKDFDIAFYVKGDQKPATLYGVDLVMSYEKAVIADFGAEVTGTDGDDVLAGRGGNLFTGAAGEDLFVLSYGDTVNANVVASTVTDFEVGVDAIGLIGLDVTEDDFDETVSQVVGPDGLQVLLDGTLVATLEGLAEALGIEDFRIFPIVPGTTPGDNQPSVAAEDAFEVDYGTAFASAPASVLDNDVDPDGDPLAALLVDDADNGTLVHTGDGTFTYTPNVGFSGEDSFTYKASDGIAQSAETLVTITVAEPIPTLFTGDRRNDVLRGTDGLDIFEMGRSLKVNMFGEGDADIFVFGRTADNGRVETAIVKDYEVGLDSIELYAPIASVTERGGKVTLTLEGDGDVMRVAGVGDFDDLTITFMDAVA